MFKFLGGILGKAFGTDESVKTGLGMLEKAGDALFYTDEEKAADSMIRAQQVRDFMTQWMESTKGQNVARRMLALMLASIWASMFLLSTFGDMAAPFLALYTDPIFMNAWRESSEAIDSRSDQMSGAMMLILGFYFAAPHLDKIVGGALEKFGGSKS